MIHFCLLKGRMLKSIEICIYFLQNLYIAVTDIQCSINNLVCILQPLTTTRVVYTTRQLTTTTIFANFLVFFLTNIKLTAYDSSNNKKHFILKNNIILFRIQNSESESESVSLDVDKQKWRKKRAKLFAFDESAIQWLRTLD